MGSLPAFPQLPVDPQPARALGISPSIPSPWPAFSPQPARVRLPYPLAKGALSTVILAMLPRQAGGPGPAMLLGRLMDSTASTTLPWAIAILSAASLAFFLTSKNSNFKA